MSGKISRGKERKHQTCEITLKMHKNVMKMQGKEDMLKMERFEAKEEDKLKHGIWSIEEDEIGKKIVQIFDFDPFKLTTKSKHLISEFLPNRDFAQVDTHFKKAANKSKKDSEIKMEREMAMHPSKETRRTLRSSSSREKKEEEMPKEDVSHFIEQVLRDDLD